jgi:hypothetical protein
MSEHDEEEVLREKGKALLREGRAQEGKAQEDKALLQHDEKEVLREKGRALLQEGKAQEGKALLREGKALGNRHLKWSKEKVQRLPEH